MKCLNYRLGSSSSASRCWVNWSWLTACDSNWPSFSHATIASGTESMWHSRRIESPTCAVTLSGHESNSRPKPIQEPKTNKNQKIREIILRRFLNFKWKKKKRRIRGVGELHAAGGFRNWPTIHLMGRLTGWPSNVAAAWLWHRGGFWLHSWYGGARTLKRAAAAGPDCASVTHESTQRLFAPLHTTQLRFALTLRTAHFMTLIDRALHASMAPYRSTPPTHEENEEEGEGKEWEKRNHLPSTLYLITLSYK